MIDEEMRRRIGPLSDLVCETERQGLVFLYRMSVRETEFKRPNVALCSWTVRGATASHAVEFRLQIEELAPDRPRVMFPRSELVLHQRAPVWMRDRTCEALQGYWCLCRPCQSAGRELFRLWYERASGPDCLWPELLASYYAAFPADLLPGPAAAHLDLKLLK